MSTVANFNDTTPAAPSGLNVLWQRTSAGLISAYMKIFGASGGSHKAGLVPDPGSSAGSTRFLREDATWASVGSGTALTAVEVNGTGVSGDFYVTVNSVNGAPTLSGLIYPFLPWQIVPGIVVNKITQTWEIQL